MLESGAEVFRWTRRLNLNSVNDDLNRLQAESKRQGDQIREIVANQTRFITSISFKGNATPLNESVICINASALWLTTSRKDCGSKTSNYANAWNNWNG